MKKFLLNLFILNVKESVEEEFISYIFLLLARHLNADNEFLTYQETGNVNFSNNFSIFCNVLAFRTVKFLLYYRKNMFYR